MELHFAKTLCSTLDRLREHLFDVGLAHVVAIEPREPARCCGLERLHLVEDVAPCEEIGLRDAGAVKVREVTVRPGAKVKVQVEHRGAPVACRGLADERRN